MAKSKKPRAQRRRYSDEERAVALAALAANDGNLKRTAAELSIPERTLRQWVTGQRHPEAAQQSAEKKPALADAIEAAVQSMVAAVVGKIEGANLQQLATSIGILTDKMQLLRNKPTEIARTEGGADDPRNLTDEELERRAREARSRAEAARADQGGAGTGAPGSGEGASCS